MLLELPQLVLFSSYTRKYSVPHVHTYCSSWRVSVCSCALAYFRSSDNLLSAAVVTRSYFSGIRLPAHAYKSSGGGGGGFGAFFDGVFSSIIFF